MALLDVLGRRKALRVLWELRDRRLKFRPLVAAAETNPSILDVRLRELRELGIVDHDVTGYGLTGAGADLLGRLSPLNDWSKRWAKQLAGAKGVGGAVSGAANGRLRTRGKPIS